MTKMIAFFSLTVLVALTAPVGLAQTAGRARKPAWLATARSWSAPPQAAQPKQPQWKSTDEYNAFTAMANEKDPKKRVSLAEAFLQKFADTDFKANVHLAMMQSYQQLNDSAKAIDAGKKALEADPDNLGALSYLSFAFPFVFKPDDPEATSKLSRAESDARHGLEVLQKLQKPANVTDEQFNQYVKGQRAIFNGAVGFVALQRKDYAAAITSFKTGLEDNPSDVYTFYRLGLAYLYSSPPDYDHSVWYIARAVSLAKAAQDPAGAEIEKFLKRAYVNYHGNEQGLSDVLAQAAGSPNPPEGFKVASMETPKITGNANIDAFNQMAFPLRLGGEKAQKTWDALKGQPIELGGFIDTVEKGKDTATYLVRIDILERSKAAEGVYDIELKDTTQPDVKNLRKGDPVTFKGTLTAYTATPNLLLSVDGEITTPLPDQPPAKPKPKPKRKPTTTHRPARGTGG